MSSNWHANDVGYDVLTNQGCSTQTHTHTNTHKGCSVLNGGELYRHNSTVESCIILPQLLYVLFVAKYQLLKVHTVEKHIRFAP